MEQVKNKETKLIVITRSDMSDGYVCVQSCHSVADFAAEHFETFKKWKNESNSIITLGIKNEESLLKLYNKLSEVTDSSLFFEPDIDSYTSICIYGTPDIRKRLRHLPLSLKTLKK